MFLFIRDGLTQGLKLELLLGPHEDLQRNPQAALWCWRNNGGTWTYL